MTTLLVIYIMLIHYIYNICLFNIIDKDLKEGKNMLYMFKVVYIFVAFTL